MERGLEVFAVIQLLVMGLSHVFQPHAWVDLFMSLRRMGHPGAFVHGLMSLWFGSLILGFHWVWSGVPAVLTVVGCLYLVKATACFLVPETQMRSLGRVSHERAWELRVPGVGYVVVAGLLAWSLWWA